MDKRSYRRNQMDKNNYRRNQSCYERWESGKILTHQELKWAHAYYRKRNQRRRAYMKHNQSVLQTPPKEIPSKAIPEPGEELHWGDTYDPDGILKEEDSTSRATQWATMLPLQQPLPHPSQLFYLLWA
jgi:hypothetical protein